MTATEDDVNHWVCCNDNLALCGETAPGEPDETLEVNCPPCVHLYSYGAPCSATLCPYW